MLRRIVLSRGEYMTKASHAAALGGVMAALAVVIMCMGTLLPLATFVCPALCMLIAHLVWKACGKRTAWAWYGAVAILSALLAPDKEAAAVFVFLGYYPIVKPWLDQRRGRLLWKGLLFNGAVITMYSCLIFLLGMTQTLQEFREAGMVLGVVTLLMGNITFFLLDYLLNMLGKRRRKHRI